MAGCVRAGCEGVALAEWWQLCVACTRPLLEPVGLSPRKPDLRSGGGQIDDDQSAAAGYDAVDWAERIAPASWGHAVDGDAWVDSIRCLALAAVATGRSSGCPHTVDGAAVLPVIAVPQATGVLRCPHCAEAVVASATATATACDRCRAAVPVNRAAVITGQSLIVVAELCSRCTAHVFGSSALITGVI